ncbi:hypothetical protein SAMN05660649_04796 [Desulfotomaculum arcticum]|uniref:Uncharacterized protein n=1 Tax=Desulfotruncus arcticus DSM 17038 TaxID=1121424 RepID=A0A1I2Z7R9_9FIRM|nr:hypothetical protein [Desulfotruncus arcticus]SFH33760.1 hypothetical protein SAMN05660649_04796 [Desulfotomaculum arcticum] [Desulfotruncus arcticus DSM 17038]
MRVLLISFFILIGVITYTGTANADVILDDWFIDTTMVDTSKTTALVDTTNHWVQLPLQSLANAINMLDNGYGYAVASKNGVTLYEMDDASGKIAINPLYSCSWLTEATGVSMRQDNLNMWVTTADSLTYFKFNGSGMSNDPALKTTGLVNVLSVASFKNKDSSLLLQNINNSAVITRYDAGSNLNSSLTFNSGINNPVAISMVNNSPDFRLFTKDASYYFAYDDYKSNYVADPAKRVTGLSDVIAASSDDKGNSILTDTDASYYINDDSGGASKVDVFSPGPLNKPVAVSLKPGTYEQAIIDGDGNVQWWAYDDATGKMVRDTNLEINAQALNSGYAHPRSYYSKVVDAPYTCTAAHLTVNDNIPIGTSINYYVSSDGGSTYTAITPGIWTAVPAGNRFVLKADLDTTDSQMTPKIYRVTLNCDLDFEITGFIDPQPAERGSKVTILASATKLSTGQEVSLDNCTVEYPLPTFENGDPALPAGESSTKVNMVFNNNTGNWEYKFIVPDKTETGVWPDDGVYQVQITGTKSGVSKNIILNFKISGNILRRLIIRTMNF